MSRRTERVPAGEAPGSWPVEARGLSAWATTYWSAPVAGYIIAALLQGVAVAATLVLMSVFPLFAFPGALPLLAIVAVVLLWGPGPGLVATLCGVALTVFIVLPATSHHTTPTPSSVASTILFVAVALSIMALSAQIERQRRAAQQARVAAEAAARRLQAIQGVTDVALTYLSLDELLERLLGQVATALQVDSTAILLPDETERVLIVHLGPGSAEMGDGQRRVAIDEGLTGQIVATRQPVIVDDRRPAEAGRPLFAQHLRALMGIPLLDQHQVVGVLYVGTRLSRHFDDEDRRWLQVVAERVALAIDRAAVYRAEQEAHTEAVLRAGEVEAVVEAMADAVFVYNVDGQIVRSNPAARALFGISDGSDYMTLPLAERLARTVTRDDAGQPLPQERWPQTRVLRGEVFTGPQAMDVLIQTLDGREVRVNVSGAPVRDERGHLVRGVLVLRDVTARRTLERRTHEALDALLTVAHLLVLSVETDEHDGDVSAQRHSVVGHRLVELTRNVLGCRRVGIITFDRQHGVQRPLAVAGLTPHQEQEWWAMVDGAPISDARAPGDPELLARFFAGHAVVVDMTQPPFSDLPNPFGVHAALIAPLSLDNDIIGFLSLDFGEVAHTYLPNEIALAEGVAQLTALALERDRLHVEREEARAAEMALRQTNQRMDEFLSVASHELRSPLTSMYGNIQLARRRLQRAQVSTGTEGDNPIDLLESVATLLERTESQTAHQARLINDLLDVSRMQTGHLDLSPDWFDLAWLMQSWTDELRQTWPARTLRLEVPTGPVRVYADADRVHQVVTNYLSNALKYSPAERPVVTTLALEEAVVTVCVRDEGPGLTSEQQQHLWDRYRRVEGIAVQDTTQAAGGGLGLGLYISRTIVEQHGGRVGVESAPGHGATFWFTLPIIERPAIDETGESDASEAGSTHSALP